MSDRLARAEPAGYSTEIYPATLAEYLFPEGTVWKGIEVKLVTFRQSGGAAAKAELLEGGTVLPLQAMGCVDAESFIAAGRQAWEAAKEPAGKTPGAARTRGTTGADVATAEDLCVGLNYQGHAAESKMAVQAMA